MRIWEATLRYTIDDRSNALQRPVQEPAIGAVWHNRLFILPLVLRRFLSHRRGSALISASKDGEWIAKLVERAGFDVVRGSSSRRGVSAVIQMSEEIASGRDVVIAPDGPRGPVYQLGPGIIFLAQKTKVPVVPVNMEYSGCWRVGRWDGFVLPHPFAKVRVIFGPLHYVADTSNDSEFEAERLRLQNAMMSLVEMR